jgi:hypothetical protein
VRQIDIPVAPYINAAGYLDEIGEERREASHHLLRHYAHKLAKKQVGADDFNSDIPFLGGTDN